MTATARSVELRSIAQEIADRLPSAVEEVVLTGSASRGVADDSSDIEMLIVTPDELELEECFSLAAGSGLTDLGTWGRENVPPKRVSGYRDGVPVEVIWWARPYAEAPVDSIVAVDLSTTGDAIANGVALRTSGLLAQWQDAVERENDANDARRVVSQSLDERTTRGTGCPVGAQAPSSRPRPSRSRRRGRMSPGRGAGSATRARF